MFPHAAPDERSSEQWVTDRLLALSSTGPPPTFLQGQERPETKGYSQRAALQSFWLFSASSPRVKYEKVELALKSWGEKFNENSVIKRNLTTEAWDSSPALVWEGSLHSDHIL